MKLFLALIFGFTLSLHAQTLVLLDRYHWLINAKEAVEDSLNDKKCIRLMNGTMLLNDHQFMNGSIDFDMAVAKERYFPGIGFRMKDAANGEVFYVRPHQSGNPDAMQYYPEYNGSGGWQLYYGEGFNHAHIIPARKWIHIHIVIEDKQAEVYFDNEKDPVLVMNALQRNPVTGSIALMNEFESPAWYANFSYEKNDHIKLKNKAPSVPKPIPGIIKTWKVSSPFKEKLITKKHNLRQNDIPGLSWATLTADARGIADLSKLAGIVNEKNTVIAQTIIYSSQPALQKFSFGFSDRAKVFFNGQLIYAGEDDFLSRDYRFLGTVGFFDAVYLPFKKGRNVIQVAVSEDIGGWGILARLEKPID